MLSHVLRRALHDPARLRDVAMIAADAAARHGIAKPKRAARNWLREASLTDAKLAAVDAAFMLDRQFTATTWGRLLAALAAYERARLAAHDAQRCALLRRDVEPFDHAPPHPYRVPLGALDWQVHPSIGTDPAKLASRSQKLERKLKRCRQTIADAAHDHDRAVRFAKHEAPDFNGERHDAADERERHARDEIAHLLEKRERLRDFYAR